MGGSSMKTYRKSAIVVGVLFILAIATLFIGQALYNPILGSPDYLELAYPGRAVVVIGILIEFVGVLGLVLIPVFLYPILKEYDEVLALGYVSFRLFEAVLLTVAQICKLMLVDLSQDYLNSTGADPSYFENMGNSIRSVLYWNDSGGIVYLVVFVIGALIIYSALYRSRLVPRWLSVFGIVAAGAMMIASVVATSGIGPAWLAVLFMMPVPLQELTLSIWLIAKGFNPSAIASASAGR
jgi:hypothetical protein